MLGPPPRTNLFASSSRQEYSGSICSWEWVAQVVVVGFFRGISVFLTWRSSCFWRKCHFALTLSSLLGPRGFYGKRVKMPWIDWISGIAVGSRSKDCHFSCAYNHGPTAIESKKFNLTYLSLKVRVSFSCNRKAAGLLTCLIRPFWFLRQFVVVGSLRQDGVNLTDSSSLGSSGNTEKVSVHSNLIFGRFIFQCLVGFSRFIVLTVLFLFRYHDPGFNIYAHIIPKLYN